VECLVAGGCWLMDADVVGCSWLVVILLLLVALVVLAGSWGWVQIG
jgi:hypothetical protein